MGVTATPARIEEFRAALRAGVLTGDGAMGTMLRSTLGSRGAFPARCLDELNLSLPALVRDVHQEYLRAGAQILGTNTFGANRQRLAQAGFSDKVRAINQAGVRISREAARSFGLDGASDAPAFVAGVMGPLGVPLEPLGLTTRAEARALFREQISALVEGGVDLLVLETFQDLSELEEAILAAREAAGPEMVVVAHLSVEEDGTVSGAAANGIPVSEITRALNQLPVDVIGLNCSFGPSVILAALQEMAAFTDKPLSAMPSAGLPSMVEGRLVYPCSPEYLAGFARRFIEAGARIVGGCCGTTPKHIQALREAVREITPEAAERPFAVEEATEPERAAQPVPLASRSRFGAKLDAREFVTIAEIVPPRGSAFEQTIEEPFALVRPMRGRISAQAACQLLQRETSVECLLQLQGRDPASLRSELLDACALGIRNVLCAAEQVAATSLAARLECLTTGVLLNPSAADLDRELRWFELHVKAGLQYVLTEPVFDLEALDEFLKRVEPYQIPVIASLRALTSFEDAEILRNELATPVASTYLERLRDAQDQAAEGLAIAAEMRGALSGSTAGVCLRTPGGRRPAAEPKRALH